MYKLLYLIFTISCVSTESVMQPDGSWITTGKGSHITNTKKEIIDIIKNDAKVICPGDFVRLAFFHAPKSWTEEDLRFQLRYYCKGFPPLNLEKKMKEQLEAK